MLSRFDDYPVHQTPDPVAVPGTGDRNVYDRYFFNGFDREGRIYFAAALGLYPNRRVMDAAFSVLRGGVQTSVHASRLAPFERAETRCGPVSVEVEAPMRRLRLRVGENEAGLAANLVFRARTPAVEEPRWVRRSGTRAVMDATRFTQWGAWEGSLSVDGERLEIDAAQHLGTRDRSWGVRPVGEPEEGAPGAAAPQFFWLWAPLHFDDLCTHLHRVEDAAGRRVAGGGHRVPLLRDEDEEGVDHEGRIEDMASVEHRIDWTPGTRRARGAELVLRPASGEAERIVLEPLCSFPMLGIGYFHPEWGHGRFKGEAAVAAERRTVAELEPLDPRHVHVQQLCRARRGGREGVGVFEQLAIGPHAPSGFEALLDGAPER